MDVDRAVILAIAQPGRRYRAQAAVARQPCRRDEAGGIETESREEREPAIDPLACRWFIESQELTLAGCLAPCPRRIAPPSRCPGIVVPLAMEQDVGAAVGALAHPPHERR